MIFQCDLAFFVELPDINSGPCFGFFVRHRNSFERMIERRGTNLRFSTNRKQASLGPFVVEDREIKQQNKTKKHAHTPSDLTLPRGEIPARVEGRRNGDMPNFQEPFGTYLKDLWLDHSTCPVTGQVKPLIPQKSGCGKFTVSPNR